MVSVCFHIKHTYNHINDGCTNLTFSLFKLFFYSVILMTTNKNGFKAIIITKILKGIYWSIRIKTMQKYLFCKWLCLWIIQN